MLKIGIIGCGGIAFGKHLPSLSQVEGVEIVAFCDLIEERAEKAAQEYGVKEAKTFKNYQDLLDLELDAVHVCTPNDTHAEISIASMHADKHVMCEKPMAISSEEAQAMIDAMEETGKKLTIAYQNRFRKDSQFLYQIAQEGQLGKMYLGKAKAIRRRAVPTWGVFLDEEAQGGGPLIDIGTHALDLTLWVMNNYKPKYVVGNAYRELAENENAANAWGPWDPQEYTVEDSAFGFITMENGASIILESSWALNSLDVGEAKTSIYGSKMGADMEDGLRLNGEEHGALFEKKVDFEIGGVDFYDGEGEDAGVSEAKAWIEAIREDKEPVVTAYEAKVVTDILEAMYQSSKNKKPIFFD